MGDGAAVSPIRATDHATEESHAHAAFRGIPPRPARTSADPLMTRTGQDVSDLFGLEVLEKNLFRADVHEDAGTGHIFGGTHRRRPDHPPPLAALVLPADG